MVSQSEENILEDPISNKKVKHNSCQMAIIRVHIQILLASLALACVYLLDRLFRSLIRTAAVLAAAGMIAWSGQFMYQEDLYFQRSQNAYMLPDEVIQICNYILEKDTDVGVLVPQEMIAKIRQYSSHLYVPLARKLPGSEIAVPGSDLTYGQLYEAVFTQRIISRDVYKALKTVGVKYIVSKDLIVGGAEWNVNAEKCMSGRLINLDTKFTVQFSSLQTIPKKVRFASYSFQLFSSMVQ